MVFIKSSNWNKFKNKQIEMHSGSNKEVINDTRAALAMVENIDENVGRIIAKTKELGIEDNTIILFFSDNGPARLRWNGGMRDKKGSTNEGGVRSPLVMKWPSGIKPGKKVERIVSVTDLLPTLSEMCGIPYKTNKSLDGISVKNSITTEEMEWEDRYILNNWKEKTSIRTQKYRLTHTGELHDIENDRNQTKDLSKDLPKVKDELVKVAKDFLAQRKSELPKIDNRPFYLGHPAMKFTQIPARDGTAHGNIKRSNIWPNCSYFTNWTSLDDSITWQVDVPAPGNFKVKLYYTCKEGDEGSTFKLSVGKSNLIAKIIEAHDPPIRGMDEDLAPRIESYVKDWKVADIGEIELKTGKALMRLIALEKPGNTVMDFRLMLFERVE